MDLKTIAIMNQKGGVGKTTTALCIADLLARDGKRVLGIDMEPQRNFSSTKRVDNTSATVMDVLMNRIPISEAIQHVEGFDVVAGSPLLSTADSNITEVGKEYRLREALDTIRNQYDFCILDTPPSLGIISINALTACDYVIIPAEAASFSLEGIDQVYQTFEVVWKYCNKDFKVLGILLTKYNVRLIHSRQISSATKQIADALHTKLFDAKIRACTAVAEAQTRRMSLFDYSKNCNAAKDYRTLVDEIMEEIA